MSNIIYKYDKETDNALHKAAFRGKVDKVKSLLNLNCISPYKTTSDGQTPLHLSLCKGHQDVANIFLQILETDFTAARQSLKQYKADSNNNFIFALGRSQIEMVRRNCKEIIKNEIKGESLEFEKCTFLLMKETIYSEPDVLVLVTSNKRQKFIVLSTVFELMKENGVISLNVLRSEDHCSVLHLAAAEGHTETVMKLLDLGEL